MREQYKILNNFKRLKRRYLTLLELMIVIGILSLVAGLVAINISNSIIDQRFRDEVGRVVDDFRLAQDLMLVLGTDVHIIFSVDREGQGIKYWMELETALPTAWEKEILRTRAILKTIRGVFIFDETNIETAPASAKGKIDLKFLSGGSVMSKGVFRLSTSDKEESPKGALNSYVCFPGYPHPIFSTDIKEEAEAICNTKEDENLEKRLTQDTMERIPNKIKDLKKIAEEQKKEEAEEQQGQTAPSQPATPSHSREPLKTRMGQENPMKQPPR